MPRNSLFLTLLFAIKFLSVFGSYLFFGRCLKRSVTNNLNVTKYEGVWYEIDKYFSFADASQSCTTYQYQVPLKLRTIDGKEYMHFIKKSESGGTTLKESGEVIFSSTNKTGRMETLIKSSKSTKADREAYWILATDYTSYSIVWSCRNFGIMNFQNVIFLAREKDPSNFVRGRAYGAIQTRGLSTKILVSTNQQNCTEETSIMKIKS